MRVQINEKAHGLKIRTLFESFFDDLILTDENPDMVVDLKTLVHGDNIIELPLGDELITIYRYLETLRSSKTHWGTLLGVRPLKKVHSLMEEGLSKEEIREYLDVKIGLQPEKIDLLMETYEVQKDVYHADRDKLSLFISIPFCPSICSYCNFHTKPYRKDWAKKYVERLVEEIDYSFRKLKEDGKEVDNIYIGGGTPTALSFTELERILLALEPFKETVKEYTIEAGRLDSFTKENIDLLKQHATRICLNPQSLHEETLKQIHRPYESNLEELIKEFQDAGIKVNCDLIAGLPGETPEMFISSLEKLLSFKPDEITIHNLSIKRGSELKFRTFKAEDVPRMLNKSRAMLKEEGYNPYYLYRQKNMLGHGENVGYTRSEPNIYNIRMMEDAHEILALGSNATSKYIDAEGLHRLISIKETTLWIEEKERSFSLIDNFIEKMKD